MPRLAQPEKYRPWNRKRLRITGALFCSKPIVFLANSRAAKGKRRRRPTVAPRKLRLIGNPAMLNAIGEAWVGRLTAKMKVRFARMADWPLADAVVELEQTSLVSDLRAGLCRHGWPGEAGGIGACCSPGPWRINSPRTDRTILHFRCGTMRSGRLSRRGRSRTRRR